MRRLVLALMMVILMTSTLFAAGSATITKSNITVLQQQQRKVLSIAVTGGTAGAYTDSTISAATYGIAGWYLYTVETVPGVAIPPGAVYTITLKDSDGFDLAGGTLSSRSVTATEMVNIGTTVHGYPLIRGNITLGITGLTTTSATTTIILTFVAN